MSSYFRKNGFYLTSKDKVGITILLGLLFVLIGIRAALPLFSKQTEDKQEIQLTQAWQAFLKKEQQAQTHYFVSKDTTSHQKKATTLFPFNPNTVSKAQLIRLGLPMRTVYTWLHYRKSGGKFYRPGDVKKLYTLTSADFQRIKPYIRIPEKHKVQHHYVPNKLSPIPLNTADTSDLKRLPGIGHVFANRIIAFRKALGGFYSVKQLKEVYGLSDSLYRKIAGRFSVNASLIKKISLNHADYKTFYHNPYLRQYAKKLLRLRKKLGQFTDIAQIKRISLINEQKYRKIAPYLKL